MSGPDIPHTDGCRVLAHFGGICGRLPDGTPCCVAEDGAPEQVVEHVTAVVPTERPDGSVSLARVDGTIIGPRSIARPEALVAGPRAGDTAPDGIRRPGQTTEYVSPLWIRELFESADYSLLGQGAVRDITFLVRDLHKRVTALLREHSELEKRLAERTSERDAARSEAAALRATGDALADGMTLWLTQTDPYSPLGRSTLCPLVDFWRSAAGSPTADGEAPR